MTNIKLLHVSAPECRPEGGFYNKGKQVEYIMYYFVL